jgi:hypothetical protein
MSPIPTKGYKSPKMQNFEFYPSELMLSPAYGNAPVSRLPNALLDNYQRIESKLPHQLAKTPWNVPSKKKLACLN